MNLKFHLFKLIPEKFINTKDYYEILNTNQLYDQGQDKIVKDILSDRLKTVLKEALTNVPYYRQKINIKPELVTKTNAYEILNDFPYLDKKTIMDDKESFKNERFSKKHLTYMTSGGSTGQGIGVWQDKRETQIEKAFFIHEWSKYGYVDNKSRIVRFGTEARKKGDEVPWSISGNRLLISPYHLNEQWIPSIYKKILSFKPEFFHTYPSCVEKISRYILENNLPPLSAKCLFLASEAFTETQYHLFKQTFNAELKAHYGLCEKSNLAFMYENEDKSNFFYKAHPIYSYYENLVDDYNNYEIIGTSYWNIVMPFIRYKTQDFGKIDENGIIHTLDGRNQEFLIDRNGGRIPGFSIKIDEFTWDYIDVYQVIQKQKGELILRIVPKSNFDVDIKKLILDKQQERWGSFFDMSIEIVEHIPRTRAGKFRLIINEITNNGGR